MMKSLCRGDGGGKKGVFEGGLGLMVRCKWSVKMRQWHVIDRHAYFKMTGWRFCRLFGLCQESRCLADQQLIIV